MNSQQRATQQTQHDRYTNADPKAGTSHPGEGESPSQFPDKRNEIPDSRPEEVPEIEEVNQDEIEEKKSMIGETGIVSTSR